jgi:outer membrane protein TolC
MFAYRAFLSFSAARIAQVPRLRRAPLLAAAVLTKALLLSGCAWFSPDAGMGVVAGIADRELKKDVAVIRTPEQADFARDAVRHLLKRTLTADAAVQIALLNNRGLQAAYNELGIAEATMVAASLPPNPLFKIERLSSSVEIEIEKRIVGNILALATLPARAEVAADRFRQAQLRAAEETLRIAAETRRAYYRTVAAYELAGFLAQAKSAAETAGQLAQQLGETGAMNKLDQAREQVFYADITAQLASVRELARSERERLVRLLGLWGRDLDFKLPAALPSLPRRPETLPDIEVEAIRRRVDLQVARIEVDALAKSYGLTQATRFINFLEVSGIGKTKIERETGERIRDRGLEVEFQVPLFDFGEVRVVQAEQTYMQAVNRLLELAVNVRSHARDAYRGYRSAYDIAGHYQREVLPLRKIISDETLLRYNAMQIDVFALLAEARQRIAATITAIEAKRDYWLATTDLKTVVAGGGISGGRSVGARPDTTGEPGKH